MSNDALMQQDAPPPGLLQMMTGFWVSQAIYVCALLGIPDAVRDGPRTPGDIAWALNVEENALHRLLRALTTIDLLVEDEGGRFGSTASGRFLQSDHPQSLRAFAISLGIPCAWQSWGRLDHAIKTGTPAFDQVYGESFFDYFSHTPQDAAIFHAAMTSVSRGDVRDVLAAYDFSGLHTIVDVGGGEGMLLRAILERYPEATGILFDLPSVVGNAQELKASLAVTRCTLVGGDMFEAVPPGGDAYILKSILHDWDDARAVEILRNCRRAMGDGGRLLVVEFVVGPPNVPDFAKWMDLNMLVLVPGRERTEAEFSNLFAAADFRLTQVVSSGGRTILEGVPV